MKKNNALFFVLLFSLLIYSAKSQSNSQDAIFRYVDVENNYKIWLGDNIDSHTKYLQKLDDNYFQLIGGFLGDANKIFIYTDKNDKIRKFKFIYPKEGVSFRTIMMSYKNTLGLPDKEIDGYSGNYVKQTIWEDTKTKFTIIGGMWGGGFYAELANKDNVHRLYAEYINDNSIETRINLKLYEDFKDNKRDVLLPKLRLTTSKIYPSRGYNLKLTEFVTDDEFIIRFEEIKRSGGLSAQVEGPTGATVDLPENINKLVLINGETIDIYRVEISDKFISISPIENSFTNLSKSKIVKHTKNRFACRCVPAISDSPICEDFFNILRNHNFFTEHKTEDERKRPSFSIGIPERNRYSKFFDYKNKTDFDLAIELLSNFVREHKADSRASISMRNWDNRRFADYDVVK